MKKGIKILMFGMIMLIGIMQVNMISAEILVSDAGVEYESEILKAFKDQTWVYVTVDIKDTSNITIFYKEDSIEVQEMKDKQRDGIIGGIIDSVLSTLSEDEFKVKNTRVGFSGFSGNITEEGARNIFIF